MKPLGNVVYGDDKEMEATGNESWVSFDAASVRLAHFELVTVASNAVAGNATVFTHNLKAVPEFLFAMPTADCRVWVPDSDRALWTNKSAALRCNLASQKMIVVLGTRNGYN